MNKGVLFIGGVADGKCIVVPNKPQRYEVPIEPRYCFETIQEEDTIFHYDVYYLYWLFDEIPIYLEEHITLVEGLKRLAKYYRPENQDA